MSIVTGTWMMLEEGTVCIRARLATLGWVKDYKLLKGSTFPERPCPQPGAAWAVVQQVTWGPVLWCRVCFQQFPRFPCGCPVAGRAVAATPVWPGERKLSVCLHSAPQKSPCSATDLWGLVAEGGPPRGHLSCRRPLHGVGTAALSRVVCVAGDSRAGCREEAPICTELWSWGPPPSSDFRCVARTGKGDSEPSDLVCWWTVVVLYNQDQKTDPSHIFPNLHLLCWLLS